MTPSRVVVLGCGNPSRGDDGLGPALMDRLETWLEGHPGAGVEALQDFQFQVEHTLDLKDRELILFVDATLTGPDPGSLQRLVPTLDASYTTHALSPAALLGAYRTLDWGEPAPAFVLGLRAHACELGQDLSEQAQLNLEAGWHLLLKLLDQPTAAAWAALSQE